MHNIKVDYYLPLEDSSEAEHSADSSDQIFPISRLSFCVLLQSLHLSIACAQVQVSGVVSLTAPAEPQGLTCDREIWVFPPQFYRRSYAPRKAKSYHPKQHRTDSTWGRWRGIGRVQLFFGKIPLSAPSFSSASSSPLDFEVLWGFRVGLVGAWGQADRGAW